MVGSGGWRAMGLPGSAGRLVARHRRRRGRGRLVAAVTIHNLIRRDANAASSEQKK